MMQIGWQDVLVTVVAAGAAALVVWRTFGHWQQSRPSRTGCEHCALVNEEMRK
jgi:hypothetical protein